MSDRKKAFIHSPELEKYHYPQDCPFRTERAGITRGILASMGMLHGEHQVEIPPTPAGRDEVERFHTPRYLDALKKAAGGSLDAEGFNMGLGTPDCPIFADMYEYPFLACGATLTAARLLLKEEADIVFNPSGGYHHAGPERAAGFCYINDVVIACMELTDARRRVLFLDMDVHHCDGVQNAFYERDDVLTMSFHESGETLFPGTGAVQDVGKGPGRGYSVNVPLPVGTYDDAYVRAVKEVAFPLLHAYDPHVIVLELGMDALSGDPLAHLGLTNNAYAEIVSQLVRTRKPILATGGGGYNEETTTRGWALLWTVLCERDFQEEMMLGLGGVMMESTEWEGGLRDRAMITHAGRRKKIDTTINKVLHDVKSLVFPLHGLNVP